MRTLQQYVENLFSDVEESQKKHEIVEEITLNLQDKVKDLMDQGKSEEDAINKAIVDFGDINEIRQELMDEQSGRARKLAKIRFGYSFWGTSLLIALFCFINFYYTPTIIWCVFPIFGVLWWPLTMFYVWMRHR
ncbi:MAG: permease prefix domain 1-containing protein [Spirochaetes bacterium]|nr:permease prefix domain 1-containing protein [Spirochaetota bacterium]